jgi:hypothetical protein
MKMKTITISALTALLLAGTGVYAARPASNETNAVEITAISDLHLDNSIEKLWKVSYSKEETPVTIALRPTAKGTEYVVRSKFFEVVYANHQHGFGVRYMPASLKEVPDRINYSVLNKQQMHQQRMLAPDKVSDEDALKLIVSYLPDLLNENYQHLIY